MSKVSGPNSVTYLELTPRFEGCVVRCISKNEHQKDLSVKEIAQILLTILGSIVNIVGGPYMII